jgi:hypothetical protein
MKHAYLNNVLISSLIYIIKIHQNIKHKKKLKKKTLKVKWNRGNTYLLIWWRFTRTLARDCMWKPWEMRGKKSKLKVKNGRDEKMNWRDGHYDL